jgi:hypothetical protein
MDATNILHSQKSTGALEMPMLTDSNCRKQVPSDLLSGYFLLGLFPPPYSSHLAHRHQPNTFRQLLYEYSITRKCDDLSHTILP